MKIAIPADNNAINSEVCQSFGRTPFYAIYDTESKQTIFTNNEAASSAGGAGIKAAQSLVDSNVSAVITYRCGENAANVLKAANIQMYRATGASLQDNITAYNEGKLSLLSDIHPGYHNHGNNL